MTEAEIIKVFDGIKRELYGVVKHKSRTNIDADDILNEALYATLKVKNLRSVKAFLWMKIPHLIHDFAMRRNRPIRTGIGLKPILKDNVMKERKHKDLQYTYIEFVRPVYSSDMLEYFSDDVYNALQTLSTQQRTIILLRTVEGLKEEEVAVQMGLSRSAVNSSCTRAKAKVRKILGERT